MGRRAGSGFMDGWYGFPAGYIEKGESATATAIREAKEETGLAVSALHPVHTLMRHAPNGREYFDVFFMADEWAGEPKIGEPDKCDDMQWFPFGTLPENTVPYLRGVLEHIRKGEVSSETGWE